MCKREGKGGNDSKHSISVKPRLYLAELWYKPSWYEPAIPVTQCQVGRRWKNNGTLMYRTPTALLGGCWGS